MAGVDDEEPVELHIEKEADDEEIQARNEISISVNDSNSEYSRNRNITLKSKEKDVDELIKMGISAMKENYWDEKKTDKKSAPGTA